MGQGATLLFNAISVIFLALTVLVAVVVISIVGGTMDAPFLAPDATNPPPTIANPPTLTPSPVPGAALTPTGELAPDVSQ